ncbi:NADPH-dependent assimilatory sulfite reductase hemoprotein subunit [Alicyclobacillus fastidiosus]|uniref:NADPH-dependent assimilatory sulfite reductase hemoprotein subunit n=1 Tax=Alicyclobacillus fastidiosus TaxID=392011 RepID=A0ABY6ZIK5_9BACL|nr:NADPH-dependent assimilatory sulfite reductase hemoprotein subunit [Alicyclobacillus fastidiosus]WAH42754.1 NADPH-dependent assimilatory sulfite reductase hemoprotein subunit [Alicyclobacillus fastidiosus]GMA64666.1 sulfite reductase subunit beta [Alicyclobacillus fastidiosus]
MEKEKKLSKNETIKQESHFLRGTIAEALQEDSTHFSEENIQVLKFHGMYQQDDRDLRRQLTKEGKERAYSMMIRARIPGGILSAEQYLQFDKLSEQYGNETMRITTRQTFQLHGILKKNIKATLKSINDVLITTLGGCGDQVRNIVTCAAPHEGPFYDSVRKDLLAVVDATSAKTNAYHEIWLDGEKVNLAEGETEEPLYGETYLPRKFKIAFGYEGDNCADIFSNDIAITAHRAGDEVAGYTLAIGGGMGRTASDKNTRPFLAKPFCFVEPSKLTEVCKTVIGIQRDFGNRENRKFARMKYLVADRGIEWFREEAAKRLGYELDPPRDIDWTSSHDHLGRLEGEAGKVHLGLFIENGRIHDTETMKLKSVLREIMVAYQPTVRLTTQQNLILCNLTEQQASEVEQLLRDAGVKLADEYRPILLESMACPSMPTCGLGIAESERALPTIIREFEAALVKLGLQDDGIIIRMTGCANGCARPYIAEIGFVGRVLGKYDVFLGANVAGTRMNQLFKEMVPAQELVSTLYPILEAYRDERRAGESFGDYCVRVGLDQLQERLVTVS